MRAQVWFSRSLSSFEQTEIGTCQCAMAFEFPGCGREGNEAEGLTGTRASHSARQGVLNEPQASASVRDGRRTGGTLGKLRQRTESLAQRVCKGG